MACSTHIRTVEHLTSYSIPSAEKFKIQSGLYYIILYYIMLPARGITSTMPNVHQPCKHVLKNSNAFKLSLGRNPVLACVTRLIFSSRESRETKSATRVPTGLLACVNSMRHRNVARQYKCGRDSLLPTREATDGERPLMVRSESVHPTSVSI